jgi:hypothetical protein
LPEARELRADIENGKARNTTSGSDGEKRVDETNRRRGAGLRQHQTGGSGANEQHKTDHQHARGIANDMPAQPFQRSVAPIDDGGGNTAPFVLLRVNIKFSKKSNFLLATAKKLVKFLTKSKTKDCWLNQPRQNLWLK